ncbi:hypothetical protein K3495_g2141 [Podosphaera aphanis]|nr:hypothetical protein K3495_g2141 [Podosphaera aphanis]
MSGAATRECQSHLELGITLAIFLWPSLTLAVNSNWGGPESQAKREWFASSTIDLVNENIDADAEWIEEFLLNVMMDEFEVNVEDGSALQVAETIVRLRKDCMQGEWAEVLDMKEKWETKNQGVLGVMPGFIQYEDDNEDANSSESDTEAEFIEDQMDVQMDAAPQNVKVDKSAEVDEDGFTIVTKKKR